MAKVSLKGVHIVRRRLSSGRVVEYHYAWRGGPRIQGGPGTPEYLRSLSDAAKSRPQEGPKTIATLVAAYKASPEYADLAPSTLRSKVRYLDMVLAEFGSMPLAALEDERVRRLFIAWRNTMANRPRTADYAVGELKALLAWGVENVEAPANPAEPIGKLYSNDRSDSIWTDDDFKRFDAEASPELRWVVHLARYTGLRQGDLLRLPWSAYDGSSFSACTSKRRRDVLIPATQACRKLMGEIVKRGPVILTTQRTRRPWTPDGLRSSFGAACEKAGVEKTFHDLRRTAATNLLKAGVSSGQVAMILGWAEGDVEALKRKYVSRQAVAAEVLALLDKGG